MNDLWKFTVYEPEKQVESVLTSYMVYKISINVCIFIKLVKNKKIQTTHPDFKTNEWSINRRYSDFEWIRERLFLIFKGLVIPPLPEKDALSMLKIFLLP